jgi:hypothetical protein
MSLRSSLKASLKDIEVRDILILARAGGTDPSAELRQLYLWRYDHHATCAKAVVGTGASFLVAVLVASIKHTDGDAWFPLLLGGGGALVILLGGIGAFLRVRRIYREYVVAQELMALAIGMGPFLQRYESESSS